MISSISIALTGLESASRRLNASASNIANLQTVGSLDPAGQQAYTPITTQQTSITGGNGEGLGVRTDYIARQNPFVTAYAPGSPFANEQGLVNAPNVDLAEEAVNTILAKLQYKANVATIRAASELSDELLRIVDETA